MRNKHTPGKPDASRGVRPVVRKPGERGFSLILIGVTLFVMMGMLGMAFDVGRMFIQKNELQTFTDASALAAVSQLDGTSAGVQNANTTATAGPLGLSKPNGYNFDVTPITNVTATYASTFAGTYDSYAAASGSTTNTYRFIKLVSSASIPLNFLPALPGVPTSMTVTSSAIAGQMSNTTPSDLAPFMPDAHNIGDTKNFGFVVGQEYTLVWGTGNPAVTTCGGDAGFVDPNPQAQHGFVNLGQGNANSALVDSIVYGSDPTSPVDVGTLLPGVPGIRGTTIDGALSALAATDTNDTATYPDYLSSLAAGTANGRRIITTAIGNPLTWNGNGNGSEAVAGFGNFLLDPSYSGSANPICATYLGPADPNGVSSGGTDGTVVYTNVLFQ